MRRETRHKLVVVAITGGLCVAVLAIDAVLGRGPADRAPPPAHAIPGTRLDRATVYELLVHMRDSDLLTYHPVAVAITKPDTTATFDWPEHPDGRITMSTDSLGLRIRPGAGRDEAADRVLVLGDSQTFGIVNDDETWPHRLELLLREQGRDVDVLNAGVGGTGPYEYLANLRRLLVLEPDVVVVGLYTGNDFEDALRFHDFYAKRPRTDLPAPVRRRLVEARRTWTRAMSQGLQQAFHMTHRPEEPELAVDAVVARLTEMAALCRERSIPLRVVLLPSRVEVGRETGRQTIRDMLRTLRLRPSEAAVNRRMTLEVKAALEEDGIPVVDLHDVLVDDPRPLYWERDHHLDPAGNQRVAAHLAPVVAGMLDA